MLLDIARNDHTGNSKNLYLSLRRRHVHGAMQDIHDKYFVGAVILQELLTDQYYRAQLFAERSATVTTPISRTSNWLSRTYQTLACTKEFAESVCKNSPRKSVYCGDKSKIGYTRVKHHTMPQTVRNARFVFAETPERAVNKGHCMLPVTAELPHFNLEGF